MSTPFDLRSVRLFAGLNEDEIAHLSRANIVRRFPRNSVVINEGDSTDTLYIINSGKVRIVRTQDNGREVVIAVLGAGDYFGEMSLIDQEPRSASVITREDSEFTMLRRQDFEEILLSNPQLTLNIMRGLCSRLRSADQNIESLALMDVYGRIARLLIEMADKDEEAGTMTVQEELTHQDIANMVGSSREMVSRILKDLSNGGYISVNKRIITINTKLPASW